MRAHEVMTSPVVTVAPGTSVDAAAEVLSLRGFGSLPVVDQHGRLIGLVTAAGMPHNPDGSHHHPGADTVQRREPAPATVADIMVRPVVAACPDADLMELATLMLTVRTPSIAIVDGAELVGIVTRGDLLRAATGGDRLRSHRHDDLNDPAAGA
jgi:CBS domain-containing protein